MEIITTNTIEGFRADYYKEVAWRRHIAESNIPRSELTEDALERWRYTSMPISSTASIIARLAYIESVHENKFDRFFASTDGCLFVRLDEARKNAPANTQWQIYFHDSHTKYKAIDQKGDYVVCIDEDKLARLLESEVKHNTANIRLKDQLRCLLAERVLESVLGTHERKVIDGKDYVCLSPGLDIWAQATNSAADWFRKISASIATADVAKAFARGYLIEGTRT